MNEIIRLGQKRLDRLREDIRFFQNHRDDAAVELENRQWQLDEVVNEEQGLVRDLRALGVPA